MSAGPSVTKVLVTGSQGFIGKNLVVALGRRPGVEVTRFDSGDSPADLESRVADADIIYHLAGVNRPANLGAFETVNVGLTDALLRVVTRQKRTPAIVLTSSTQAAQANPYGASKKRAEDLVAAYAEVGGARAYIFRLPGVFGKWSRPNYNSVVSTFCYNIAHDLPLTISDPAREVELVYIDEVVAEFLRVIDDPGDGVLFRTVPTSFRITLGELADRILALRDIRRTLIVPDLSDELTKRLMATYTSYLEPDALSYALQRREDPRGVLAELIKSDTFGQVFISVTHPGFERGHHYHDRKVEKFCVIAGEATISFRHILRGEVTDYRVSGDRWEIVDIPPGYTHAIVNSGDAPLVTLFWANEVFDQASPDTHPLKVRP